MYAIELLSVSLTDGLGVTECRGRLVARNRVGRRLSRLQSETNAYPGCAPTRNAPSICTEARLQAVRMLKVDQSPVVVL